MSPWTILGITQTSDKKLIKKAYAILLKQYNPETNPDEFMRIRSAYESALAISEWITEEPEEVQNSDFRFEDTLNNEMENPDLISYENPQQITEKPEVQNSDFHFEDTLKNEMENPDLKSYENPQQISEKPDEIFEYESFILSKLQAIYSETSTRQNIKKWESLYVYFPLDKNDYNYNIIINFLNQHYLLSNTIWYSLDEQLDLKTCDNFKWKVMLETKNFLNYKESLPFYLSRELYESYCHFRFNAYVEMRQGNYELALEACEKANEIYDQDYRLSAIKAIALFHVGDLKSARITAKSVLKKRPRFIEIHEIYNIIKSNEFYFKYFKRTDVVFIITCFLAIVVFLIYMYFNKSQNNTYSSNYVKPNYLTVNYKELSKAAQEPEDYPVYNIDDPSTREILGITKEIPEEYHGKNICMVNERAFSPFTKMTKDYKKLTFFQGLDRDDLHFTFHYTNLDYEVHSATDDSLLYLSSMDNFFLILNVTIKNRGAEEKNIYINSEKDDDFYVFLYDFKTGMGYLPNQIDMTGKLEQGELIPAKSEITRDICFSVPSNLLNYGGSFGIFFIGDKELNYLPLYPIEQF